MPNESVDRRVLLGALGGVAGAAALSRLAHAGPLDPPVGPVSPTGHTMQELWSRIARTGAGVAEPRIPIQSLPSSAAALHVISQPGSYYLTADLQGVAGKHGIEVASDDVEIDLSGFAIRGAAGSLSGINAAASRENLAVRRGTITGWDQHGINGNSVSFCTVEGVVASHNAGNGVRVAGSGIIRHSKARNNGTGLSLGNNSWCVECLCSSCGVGIHAQDFSTVRSCTLQGNGTGVDSNRFCSVERCSFGGGGVGLKMTDEATAIGNTFVYTGTAIQVSGSGCFIIQNTSRSSAYSMGSGNTYGPIVSVAGIGALGSASDQNHPWANFIH